MRFNLRKRTVASCSDLKGLIVQPWCPGAFMLRLLVDPFGLKSDKRLLPFYVRVSRISQLYSMQVNKVNYVSE